MNVKNYLLKYKRCLTRAERYKERIAQIETILKGVNLDGMPKGYNLSDPTKTAALNLMILKEEYQLSLIEAERIAGEIVKNIEKMKNPQFGELLYSRYILLLSWNDVSERLRRSRIGKDYDIKYVLGEMHKRALKAFAEVLDE